MEFVPLEMIQNHIRNHVSVVTGQSGVGKSTFLNHLDGSLELKTDIISKALGRGKHTTRCVTLIPLEGGWIADTPGFGTLEFESMTETDLSQRFIDFFKISPECKFKGCLHINEPGCAVRKAWSEKKIMNTRYENYLGFINEIKMNRKW
jgi:ribosome biogenesis GTPase